MDNTTPIVEEVLSIQKASELTGYSKSTLYGKSSRGEIPVSNMGNKLIFFRSDLLAWMRSYKKESITKEVK